MGGQARIKDAVIKVERKETNMGRIFLKMVIWIIAFSFCTTLAGSHPNAALGMVFATALVGLFRNVK